MPETKNAILSVSDKKGIEELGLRLVDFGYRILSTGGTANVLTSAQIKVVKISDYTKSPEVLGGRVKTLHPKIHAGILALDTDSHKSDLKKVDASLIDLVVVNLYPFEEAAKNKNNKPNDLVEEIDIGGVTLLRAAAKNFKRVTVVCDPLDYEKVIRHLSNSQKIPLAVRYELALKAFAHTANYDASILDALSRLKNQNEKEK